jgi:hypothetical protein
VAQRESAVVEQHGRAVEPTFVTALQLFHAGEFC